MIFVRILVRKFLAANFFLVAVFLFSLYAHSAHASVEISDGSVVGLWHLDGDSADTSGGGYHGTDSNNMVYSAGLLGDAAEFLAGSSRRINLPNFSIATASIAFWFRGSYNSGGRWISIDQSPGGSGDSMWVDMEQGKVCVAEVPSYSSVCTTETFDTANWHFIVVTKTDGDVYSIYADNASMITADLAANNVKGGDGNAFGYDRLNGVSYQTGLLDEVVLFNTVIDASTREALWNFGNGQPVCLAPGCGTSVPGIVPGTLRQYRSNATSTISEGDVTDEATVVFSAKLDETGESTSTFELHVEIRALRDTFTGSVTATSVPVTPGETVFVPVSGLANGQYHWRARAVNTVTNASSSWQEFGTPGNRDFYVEVPSAVIFPEQLDHGQPIGLGSAGFGQKLIMPSTATVSKIAMWIGSSAGHSCCSQSYLTIYADQNGVPGTLVVTSTPITIPVCNPSGCFPGNGEFEYDFDSPITLAAGNSYWLVPSGHNSQWYDPYPNDTEIFGSANDPYPDGIWSGNILYDAYFRLVVVEIPPTLSLLQQFKSDATTPINEGDTTTENAVVFGAMLQSSSTNLLQLQVELRRTDELSGGFSGTPTATSTPVSSGSAATTTTFGLIDGNYHWRARAVDTETNASSSWQEFGTTGNTDFVVHQVPLYTQVESPFPDTSSTKDWAVKPYGNGNYSDCLDTNTNPMISTIRRCGCAIASMSMLSHYYGVATGTDNSAVDPGTMNTWLSANDGYKSYNATSGGLVDNGNLNWGKAGEYLGLTDGGVKKTYFTLDYHNASATTQGSTIDSYINALKPAIAYSNKFGHYLVINSKLANSNYAIRDPKWFSTRTLNETDNVAQNVRGYNKVFNTANLFSFLPTPQRIAAAMYLYLASPAEYLVTDPQGRRLGVDPTTNTAYNEIPSGSYSLEGPVLDSDTAIDPGSLHMVKTIYISSPLDGNYDVKVIGTGTGSYTANSFVYDNNGNSQSNAVQGNTTPNLVTDYSLSFSASSSQGTALIIKYNFGGFHPPIKSDGSGVYQLGRTLPVKFQLTDATGAFVTSTIAHLLIAKASDGIAGTEEIPLSSGNADTGNQFRYDLTNNQYIFNLDTTPLSRGTWQLRADLGDGTTNTVLISLRN